MNKRELLELFVEFIFAVGEFDLLYDVVCSKTAGGNEMAAVKRYREKEDAKWRNDGTGSMDPTGNNSEHESDGESSSLAQRATGAWKALGTSARQRASRGRQKKSSQER